MTKNQIEGVLDLRPGSLYTTFDSKLGVPIAQVKAPADDMGAPLDAYRAD